MTKTAAVLFDLDGTLIDNMRFHFDAWKRIAAEHGVPLDDARIQREFAGKKNAEIIPVLLPGAAIEPIAAKKEALYRELYAGKVALVRGAAAFLQLLRERGIKVAVASAAPPENRAFVFAALNERFDAVAGGEEVPNGKPSPDIFLLAAQRLGVAPAQCLVFEDAVLGVRAGKAAGMRVAGVTTTESAHELEAAGAEKAIPDFLEALPLVTY